MKFVVNRDVCADAVSFVVKLIPQRPTMPILGGVLIEAKGDRLSLSSFDHEVSSRTSVKADIEAEGSVLVQGRILSEIASRLPQAPVEFTLDDTGVKITCGSAKFHLPTMPILEFPKLPVVEGTTGTVKGADFAEAVSQVAVAASREDIAPVITGVNLGFGQDELSLVATDRYRVAVRAMPWTSGFEEAQSALVHARTLSEVGKSFASADEVTITLMQSGERRLIAFTANERTVTSNLIAGRFPPVDKLFPTEAPPYAVLQVSELVDAVRRVSLVLERDAALRFTFAQDGLQLEALGSEQAQASEQIDAVLHGEDIVISLKPMFLVDGVSAIHSEFVRVAFTKSGVPNKPGPVLLTAQTSRDEGESAAFRYLLQPNLIMR